MADPVDLTIDEKCLVTLAVTDRALNPASFDAPPAWEASSDNLIVEPAVDGMSATVTSGDVVEEAVLLTVTGDGDLGDGVRPIIGTLQFNLTAGEAQFVTLTAGPPEPKD